MRRLRAISLVVLLASALSCSGPRQPELLKGRVTVVADGDTITILDAANKEHAIRLQGIDAPERQQEFGTQSRQHLVDLVFGKEVAVDGDKTDQYGRVVAKVLVDGQDINLALLSTGVAWFYRDYAEELSAEDRVAYASAEDAAKTSKSGLWLNSGAVPPWEYRHPATQASEPSTQLEGGTKATGSIIGNRRSRIYHWLGCPYYNKIAPHNREYFKSRDEAERAGYRPARNCEG